jgi:hypothetical protein
MANVFSNLIHAGEKKEKYEKISRFGPEQQPLYRQSINAGLQPGAGGAFGNAADYYRGNLSNNPEDFQAMAAPELRRYQQEFIPDLAEQFAGMGSGGLSSSGFRNAAVQGATDLSERLGAIRAQLRSQAAQGLTNIGQIGLQPSVENVYRPAQQGFFQQALPGLLTAAGTALAGPAGAAIGNVAGNWISNKGGTSPYGDEQAGSISSQGNLPQYGRR